MSNIPNLIQRVQNANTEGIIFLHVEFDHKEFLSHFQLQKNEKIFCLFFLIKTIHFKFFLRTGNLESD